MTTRRLQRGKEDAKRFHERFGEGSVPRPAGRILWCHGASIGESLSVLPLLTTLHTRLPDWHFVLTTNTLTSAKILSQRLPPFITHQFIPWDHPVWVQKFLEHWRPDAVLWLESELWPNFLAQIKQRRLPAALLNARMRPKTAKRWQLAKSLARDMLSSFRFILVGARDYRPIFESLGGQQVRYIGSLKFGAKPLPVEPAALDSLRQAIGTRACIGLISTHEDEEALFLDTVQQLRQRLPGTLIYWVPRQPQRGPFIREALHARHCSVASRSLQEIPGAATDVYLADTVGEMGLCYALAPLAVIGGSFVPHGGQNPIEGVHFGTAVVYGPHMFNFPELCKALEDAQAAQRVTNTEQLIETLVYLRTHAEALAAMQAAARDLATQNVAVIDAFADEIIAQLVTS